MEEGMTRAQVEGLLPLATHEVHTVDLGKGHVGVYSALSMMIAHDAALRAALAKVTEERDSRVDYGWWTKKDVPSQDAQMIIKRWEDRWYGAQKYDVNQPMPSFYWVAHQTRCACLLPATEYERNVAYTMMVNNIEYELVVLKLRAAQARIAELEGVMKEAAGMAGQRWLEAQLLLAKALK